MIKFDTKEEAEGKGKGKEQVKEDKVEQLPKDKSRSNWVINPNYQPAPKRIKSDNLVGHGDYLYDSDEEEKAIRRAIEESLKTQESQGDSSYVGL